MRCSPAGCARRSARRPPSARRCTSATPDAATAVSSRCSTSTTTSCGSAARPATSSAASSRTAASSSSTRRTSKASRRRTARLIEKYGYAPLELVREMVEGSDELRANLCVAAHLAHVSYAGPHRTGRPRRAALSHHARFANLRRRCRRVKLGLRRHAHRSTSRAARRDPDTLVVDNAGRDLYLVDRDRPE